MKKIFLVVIIIIVLFSLCGCVENMVKTMFNIVGMNDNVCIFSEISQLEQIEESFLKYGDVERYQSSDKDKYLKKLSYNNFYAAEYQCEDFEFEIYAYEFESITVAENYYENVVGNTPPINPEYSSSGNFINKSLLVIDGSNVYLAKYPYKYRQEVESFLASNFEKLLFETQVTEKTSNVSFS